MTGSPSLEQWRELYVQAMRFKEIAPWNWMSDCDLFGVKNPADGETGYCCVLGAAKKIYGLAVYRGSEGLAGYWEELSHSRRANTDDLLYLKNCLLLTFDDRAYVEKPDLRVIQNLGIEFRGHNAWPVFRDFLPGYAPWYLTEKDAAALTLYLEQANDAILRFKADPAFFDSPEPGSYLVRVCEGVGDARAWKDAWIAPAALRKMVRMVNSFDVQRLDNIVTMPSGGEMAWELDLFYTPAIVGAEGQRPYFPTMLMFVDHDSGFIFNGHMSEPDQYLVVIHEQLLQTIEKAGIVPKEIRVKKEELCACLAPLAEKLGIEMKLVKRLPAVDAARRGMAKLFGRRKRGGAL